jgi:glycosyltransferase involved in cell wall biosynthesis
MKIVFIGGRDIHSLGGIEAYMYNLSLKLVEMGHQPVVYCESDHNAIVFERGIKIIYMKGFKSNLICKPWVGLKATIRTMFKEKDAAIIHYNTWPPSMWSFIPRMFGKKTLLQEHGFEWQRTKYNAWQVKILRIMERLTAYINTNITCVSNEQVDYFREHYRQKAIHIPTAVNLPEIQEGDFGILEKFGLERHKYFLFMGRLSKEKNIDQLIDAYHGVDGYKLVIAGKNNIEPEYE